MSNGSYREQAELGANSEPTPASHAVELDFEGRPIVFRAPVPDDHILNTMRMDGTFYERELLAVLRESIPAESSHGPRRFAVDAGAYIGTHSVFFAKFCELDHVVAFEPNGLVTESLAWNLGHNGVEERVRLRPVALGASASTATLRSPYATNLGSSSLLRRFGPDSGVVASVEVVTLDSEIDSHDRPGLVLLKIDVEGYEVEVLRGARESVFTARPVLAVEVYTLLGLLRILRELKGCGYRIVDCRAYRPTYVMVHRTDRRSRRLLAHLLWLGWAALPRGARGRLSRRVRQLTGWLVGNDCGSSTIPGRRS